MTAISDPDDLTEYVPIWAYDDQWDDDTPGPNGAEPPPEEGLGGLIDWHLLLSGDHVDQEWLVEPFLALGRSHALYAPAKAGKSLLALEIAAAVASGRPALQQPAGPPRSVLYVDMEMTEDDLRDRIESYDYTADELSLLHYHLLPPIAALDTVAGGAAIVAEAARIGAQLAVVDTVARSISGEENSADTIANLARYTFTPLKRARTTSLRVDHAGKNLAHGQRGTSAKNDDVDVVWQLTEGDANTLMLKATHRRLNWVPETVGLTRVEDPLRHKTGAPAWPPGTLAAAAKLDAEGAPIDITVGAARTLIGGKTATVAAAVKYRRFGDSKRETLRETPPKQGNALRETLRETPTPAPLDLRETLRETQGNALAGKREIEPPPVRGAHSQPQPASAPAPDPWQDEEF